MSSQASSSSVDSRVTTAIVSTVAALATASIVYQQVAARAKKQSRYKYVQKEIETENKARDDDNVVLSIISEFDDFKLEYGATVEDANKKRTQKYYQLARDAHLFDLVPAVRSYPRLRNEREAEMKRIFRYQGQNKSHRTVLVMLDDTSASMLCEARADILRPFDYSHDPKTSTKAWIPAASILPKEHLHVTIATPWWWHGMRPGNEQLSQELVARFRQALVLEFHHAFQLELERIVLLGGKTLVALWRCVGERSAGDYTIFDRHGEGQDPIVKLRRDIVQCFTGEANNNYASGQEPLTYAHRHFVEDPITPTTTTIEEAPSTKPKRRNTIELKTPGLGDRDGFIHTTLARLPISCLAMSDFELEPVHRLAREATATYCGHRMVVDKFRFVETTGEGGESNPCVAPIFDETVEAPRRIVAMGNVQEIMDLHAPKIVDRNATIGNLPPSHASKPSMDGLFIDPSDDDHQGNSRLWPKQQGVNTDEVQSAVAATGLGNPLQD
ncbi:expressed unknown protein [Seminavis robusta]|uniref:Uncharacterized protein n=1 Tax=Seminavis robusta TaxID=568900 RepID=A0A9N8DSL3_9STRA|nr:expressed unknown protein [Seminavis robusta]|eukprot:Sro221_g090950.1 n/a (500) ;mRNA; r:28450-30049